VLQNNSNQAADTEPFNTSTTHNLVIRDMTVNAGGSPRSTSDAIDMDGGNNALIENVKILQSRARGIVFDGKDIVGGQPRTANGNIIRGCVISGVQTLGIQFLASSYNRVEGCTITNVGGHGIQATKSSTSADQPNKKPIGNVITGNLIDNAGQDGINITSGDSNEILGNTIMNSSNVLSGRDGIRITGNESIACDDNRVANNRAGDNQSPKTQRYGLDITTSLCHGTIVGPGNDFSGNLSGPFKNSGTGTILL
jgi:parallel beta-helix repeat protein